MRLGAHLPRRSKDHLFRTEVLTCPGPAYILPLCNTLSQKVLWVYEHKMSAAYEETTICYLVAQPIKCMKDLNCKCCFKSNYRETIFLRREFIEGRWIVEYSLVIQVSTSYVKVDLGGFLGYTNYVIKAMFPCCCSSSIRAWTRLQYNTKVRMGCANQMTLRL